MDKSKQTLLISLDGLSLDDLWELSELLPLTVKALKRDFQKAILNTRPFVSAQPIWAELLTGRPWFENGCSSYAIPTDSLNRLEVFSESHLQTAITLFDEEQVLVVNVPILKPDDRHRIWFSDGSMPSSKLVSPAQLRKSEPFAHYQARGMPSIVEALTRPNESALSCLTVEHIRLECMLKLMAEKTCSRGLVQFSIFDHLAHLFGADWFVQRGLRCFEQVKRFFAFFDDNISRLLANQDEFDVSIISCYSHVPCHGRLNLNQLLQEGGFVDISGVSESSNTDVSRRRRSNAIAAIVGNDHAAVHAAACLSNEGRLRQALAASPVYGCVFINDKARFLDGIVDDADIETIRARLKRHLLERLASVYGHRVSIAERPNNQTMSRLPIPDFVVSVDGIEMSDINEPVVRSDQGPRTTHFPEGFVFLRSQSDVIESAISPRQLGRILRQLS